MRPLSSRLVGAVALAALLSVVAALVAAFRLPEGSVDAALNRFSIFDVPAVPAALFAGAVVAMISQLARLRVRVGGGLARLAWGEAAVVLLCASLPPAVVPPISLVGFGAAHAALHVLDSRHARARPVREASMASPRSRSPPPSPRWSSPPRGAARSAKASRRGRSGRCVPRPSSTTWPRSRSWSRASSRPAAAPCAGSPARSWAAAC
ncbi:hypothetical protein [Dactylosporangium darangshiense]|uniref:hypothetical protein n=1 Tax=Dactylosporangium darangshiense TaxID=579108 RepID=UPI003645DA4C